MNVTFKQSFGLNKRLHLCIRYPVCIINARCINNSLTARRDDKHNNKEVSKVRPFNENEDHTWVGPPHPVSNLRLKVFPTGKHLTKEEVHFYEKSKEIQDWNQEYWVSHNRDFEQSKKSYMEKRANEKDLNSNLNLNTEEMANFYKEFLNKNYEKHISYNWQWYKKNFELLYLSAKAQVSKLRKSVKS